MADNKFRKHQTSRKKKFLLQDSEGNILISSNDEGEYMKKRQKYVERLERETEIRNKELEELKKKDFNWKDY